ncbi:chemotaxis protein CheX [Blastopirellula sp. JC732]|uniref:Chemotaxis protein CheX n=1 Tax=Blastopirellula sediminis TaxID=2894196 RepID=A0A9X1MKY9_9BACT|nr:chemotaxis protein CheX [Blastopirellula sediminis]MCC9608462.1 chemotaxis protein CheX [Blastopirellula sediminis]MCC9628761.1 chemotaxis protein CheX [Blastopirellula sediminis]
MQVEYINPFIRSMTKTFDTMLGCEITRGSLILASDFKGNYDVCGVIGLSGRAQGVVVVNLSKSVALQAAATMLMMDPAEVTDLNEDVIDAVGEIANMVAGAAKAELEDFELSISLPNVVVGSPPDIRFPSEVHAIAIPFECPWGPMSIKVGFAPVHASA